MFKKITALLTIITMVSLPAGAFAQDEPAEEELWSMELSLNDAIGMALENNPKLTAADSAIHSAELSLEIVNENQKEFNRTLKYVNIPVVISEGLETAYMKHGYYPKAAQTGVDIAVMNKSQTQASIAYGVTEKYYNVKLLEDLVKIANTGLEMAKDNEQLMKNQLEAGYVSALEVRNASNALRQAENSVKSYMRSLELATKSLKIDLQIENSPAMLILTDEIEIPSLPENADDMIESAVDTRYDMTALKKDYELKTELFDITQFYVNDNTSLYHTAYSNYLNSQYTYQNAVKMMKIGLLNEYSGILAASDAMLTAEDDLDIKQAMYESAAVQYELGLITNLELTRYMANLDQSRVQLENAKLTYLLSVLKFGYDTVIGL